MTRLGFVRGFTVAYFVLFALAVVWPGMLPFNRIEPLVLGLPFSMAWVTGWILGSVFVLWWMDRTEARHRSGKED